MRMNPKLKNALEYIVERIEKENDWSNQYAQSKLADVLDLEEIEDKLLEYIEED